MRVAIVGNLNVNCITNQLVGKSISVSKHSTVIQGIPDSKESNMTRRQPQLMILNLASGRNFNYRLFCSSHFIDCGILSQRTYHTRKYSRVGRKLDRWFVVLTSKKRK